MVFEAFINSLVQVYIDSKAFGSTNLHDRSALHCAVLGGGVVKYLACFHATTASSRSPATTIRTTPFPRSSSLREPLHALTRTVALSQEFYDLLATTVPLKDFPYNRVGLDVNDEGGHGRSSATRRSTSCSSRRSSTPSVITPPPFGSCIFMTAHDDGDTESLAHLRDGIAESLEASTEPLKPTSYNSCFETVDALLKENPLGSR